MYRHDLSEFTYPDAPPPPPRPPSGGPRSEVARRRPTPSSRGPGPGARRLPPFLVLLLAALVAGGCADPPPRPASEEAARIPVGVLGDSDSHSYGDSLSIRGVTARGGPLRNATLQWTEIWSRLRPFEVTLGPWGEWGSRGTVAQMSRALGLHGRAPRKRDFRFNMALSGARCDALGQGMTRQLPPLLDLMDEDPDWWARGLVVVRIGVNSFGQPGHLDALARGDSLPAVRACAAMIRESVEAIRARHPRTRIALVGIYNNVHWARVADRWQDPVQLERIARGLRVFDSELVALADADPGIAFHDDQAWMESRWGGRGPDGAPAYRPYLLDGRFAVTNTVGDDPANIVVGDGHLGTAANGLWLQSLVEVLNRELDMGLTPIADAEIASLLPRVDRSAVTGLPSRTP